MSKELFGKYRAEVVDVNDPEQKGRIRVKCPKVQKGNTPLEWAESCFPPGLFTLPKRGDKVWIEFEEGHIDKPIWMGVFMTKPQIEAFGDYDVENIVIKDSKGSFIKFESSGDMEIHTTGILKENP